jgi:hypothetical protein
MSKLFFAMGLEEASIHAANLVTSFDSRSVEDAAQLGQHERRRDVVLRSKR